MAIVNSTQDKPPIDTALEALATEALAAGKPIRIRVQPDIYDYQAQLNKVWAGLVWTVECEDVEEGRRLREGLSDFFKAFGSARQGKLLKALQALGERRG